ncbi:LAFA_0D12904g1_1 [Lachancea sp. 'fantastica']|nr:LAFA_0D12904g1_1 [Lachancea sp. 'fantastica']
MRKSKPDVLVHVMERLVGEKRGRIPRKPDCAVSPVITNFEKWAGKPRKLYFRDASKVPRIGECLQNNMYAAILASPMRLDRVTRLHCPKELLTQVKLVQETDSDVEKPFRLDIAASARRIGPASYISNRNALLVKNQASPLKWVPTSSLNKTIRHIDFRDIGQPKAAPIAQIVRFELLKQVYEGLSQQLQHDANCGGNGGNNSPTSCDIRIISDPLIPAKLQIQADQSTVMNLAGIDDKTLQDMFLERPEGFIVNYASNKNLCNALYNLLIHTD